MNEKIQDFFLNCEECVLENPRNFYGSFTLGPFKNSQSLTVANALRRTLLSELHGIAITHLEIDGAIHEYSTLLGVRESILDILLNFKHIVLKNTSPLKKSLLGYLNVRGPGIVRAADLKLPSIVQCVDPDQYIATLAENGKLTLKFTISDFQNFTQMKEISENFQIPEYTNNVFLNIEMSKNIVKNSLLKTLKNNIANLQSIYSRPNYSLKFFVSNKKLQPLQKNSIKQKFMNASASLRTLHFIQSKQSIKKKSNLFSEVHKSEVAYQSKIDKFTYMHTSKLAIKLANWQANKQAVNKQQHTQFKTIPQKKFFYFQKKATSTEQNVSSLPSSHVVPVNFSSLQQQQQDNENKVSKANWQSKVSRVGTTAQTTLRSLTMSKQIKKEIQPTTNSLWVDPLFNPILKVNYLIETIQPIQTNTPNQRIRVELWTNGSIHPRKAFYDALTYLKTIFDKLEYMKYLNYTLTNTMLESEKTMNKILKTFEYDFRFYNSLEEQKNVLASTQNHFIPKEIQKIEKDYSVELLKSSYKNILEIPLEKLSLSSRLKKTLTKNDFFVIGDILKYTPSELKTFPGIGNVYLSIIQKHFKKIGLKLKSKKMKK
jgi:DNA-directed RNA polymerase alpha subunit